MESGNRGPNSTDIASMYPVALDRYIQSKLSTRRLVGEFPFEGPAFARAKQLVEEHFAKPTERDMASRVEAFARTHPALFAYYLAGIGAHHGHGGELWKHVPFVGGRASLQTATGQAFEKAVKEQRLLDAAERLRDEPHMRYVSQVMFHAIVPKESSQRLLERVSGFLNEGLANGTELHTALLHDDRSVPLPEPVLHFLRYGDDLAEDYLNRLALLLKERVQNAKVSAEDFGLAQYLDDVMGQVTMPRSLAVTSSAARPKILFDPWTEAGPELVLPPTSKIDKWLLRGDFEQHSFQPSRFRTRIQPLPATSRWIVEGRCNGELASRLDVISSAGGVYLFGLTDGRPVTSRLWTGDDLVALVPDGSTLHIGNRRLVRSTNYAPLSGDWGGYTVVDVDLGENCELTVEYGGHDDSIRSEVILRCGSENGRAALIGEPLPGVAGHRDTPVYDGLPMLRIPRGDNPKRWFVSLNVNDEPRGVRQVAQLGRIETRLGEDDNLWSLDQLDDIPLVAQIGIRVSGPLGGDLDQQFIVVSRLDYRPPSKVVAPYETFVNTITADDGVQLGRPGGPEPGRGAYEFAPGSDTLELTASTPREAAELQFKIPRLLWDIGPDIAAESFGLQKVSVTVEEFLDSEPFLWVNTGLETRVRAVLRDRFDAVVQQGSWKTTSRRTGRLRLDLRSFRDTVRHTSEPLLVVSIEAESVAGSALEIRRDYKVRWFEFMHGNGDAFCEFEEIATTDGRVVRIWDSLRPWIDPVDFRVPDGLDGSQRILLGPLDLSPSHYIAELTVEVAETRFPSHDSANMCRFDVSPDQDLSTDRSGQDELANFPTREAIEAAPDETEAMRLASEALQAITLVVASSSQLNDSLKDLVKHHCSETLLDDPARLAKAIVAEHQTGRLGEHIARLAVLQLITGACDCPISAGSLNDRDYRDLWEVSPVLAAAMDRPVDEAALSRWKTHLGWVLTDGPVYDGKPLKTEILKREIGSLRKTYAKITSQRVVLLQMTGFLEAMVRWLLQSAGDYSETQRWQEGQRTLLGLSQGEWPEQARVAHAELSQAPDPLLRLPADLLAISLQLVCFNTNPRIDSMAIDALSAAYEFAPRLVERQLVVALLYHLREQGSLRGAPDGD